MRVLRIILPLILLLSVAAQASAQPVKKNKNETVSEATLQLINSRCYTIDITTMLPRKMNSRSLPPWYYLEVKNDSIDSCLPYFGEAYKAQLNSEGLIFESTINEYEQKVGRKKQSIITINTRTREDYYVFTIEVYSNDLCHISVSSNYREGIEFMGTIRAISEEEESEEEQEENDD